MTFLRCIKHFSQVQHKDTLSASEWHHQQPPENQSLLHNGSIYTTETEFRHRHAHTYHSCTGHNTLNEVPWPSLLSTFSITWSLQIHMKLPFHTFQFLHLNTIKLTEIYGPGTSSTKTKQILEIAPWWSNNSANERQKPSRFVYKTEVVCMETLLLSTTENWQEYAHYRLCCSLRLGLDDPSAALPPAAKRWHC